MLNPYPYGEVYIRDTTDPEVLYIKTNDNTGRLASFKKYSLQEEEMDDQTNEYVTKQELTATLEAMFKKYMPQNKQRHRDNKGVNNAE